MGLLYDVTVDGRVARTIGVFHVSDSLTICVHEIDETAGRVLATVNGENPKWYPMTEELNEVTDTWQKGFTFGYFFVPFSEVMKV